MNLAVIEPSPMHIRGVQYEAYSDASGSVLRIDPICECHIHFYSVIRVELPDYADGAWLVVFD